MKKKKRLGMSFGYFNSFCDVLLNLLEISVRNPVNAFDGVILCIYFFQKGKQNYLVLVNQYSLPEEYIS